MKDINVLHVRHQLNFWHIRNFRKLTCTFRSSNVNSSYQQCHCTAFRGILICCYIYVGHGLCIYNPFISTVSREPRQVHKLTSSSCYLQEVGLVCQWNGLSQGDIEGVRWDAAQEGHGVRAPEERVVLTRFSWNRVLILVLQS